jgi:Omp85 superfamily domain
LNRWVGLFFACCVAALASVASRRASAQNSGYSALEQSVVEQKLDQRGLLLEPLPEGKQIEEIQIVTLDVFDERDPMPDFVNVFHATTREHVIRRELLFEEGTPYRALLANETARNLRQLIQLSIVLVVPAKGSAPDRVRVLVITKDVWSLRLNWLLQSQNAHINYLALNPSEENLFGSHAVIGGLFVLDPASYSLGASLSHKRLLGTHELLTLSANFIRNRDSGEAEGSFGEFRYGQPLYSLDTRWSWGAAIVWRHDIARQFYGIHVAGYDAKATKAIDRIPEQYNRDRLYGGYEVVRSFGRRLKYDLSVGIEALRSAYDAPDLSGFDPRAAAEFLHSYLPPSDQRISPFVQLHAHRTDYSSLIEVETLGLQEDFRRGHDLVLRIYPASSSLGSTRDLLGSLSILSYTFPIGDGLLRPLLGSRIQYASHGRDDALFQGDLRFVSPRLGFGRLVLDGEVLDRARNYSNARSVLGGDNRLRGYAPGALQGTHLLAANAELRTTSLDILSAQVGAAAFYDLGATPDDFRHVELRQGTGVGLRVLFPEFDRIVFRADWGFPLSPGYHTLPGAFFVSFAQAFAMPAVAAPSVLTETL